MLDFNPDTPEDEARYDEYMENVFNFGEFTYLNNFFTIKYDPVYCKDGIYRAKGYDYHGNTYTIEWHSIKPDWKTYGDPMWEIYNVTKDLKESDA